MAPRPGPVAASLCFLALLAALLPPPARAAERDRTPAGAWRTLSQLRMAPHPRLGLAFPGARRIYYRFLPQAGLGVVRLGVSWREVEAQPYAYRWTPLDMRVVQLQRMGIDPFLTLYSDAQWATRPNTHGVKNGTPLAMDVWTRFVGVLVERYDGDGLQDAPGLLRPVRYFQVANEWMSSRNRSGGWAGTHDELIAYINASYRVVKARHPDAVFVLGGIASMNLDLMVLHEGMATYTARQRLRAGDQVELSPAKARDPIYNALIAGAYGVLETARYDAADVHLYGPVDRDQVRIRLVRTKTAGRPLVSTECGGPSLDYQVYTPAAHFLAAVDRNLTTLSEGLEFALWFRLGEHAGATWGNRRVALLDAAGRPKPAFHAYRLLSYVLRDMERVERVGPGHFVVHRAGAAPVVIAWQTKDQTSLQLAPRYARARVLRIVDARSGAFTAESLPSDRHLMLEQLPAVVGLRLPEAP